MAYEKDEIAFDEHRGFKKKETQLHFKTKVVRTFSLNESSALMKRVFAKKENDSHLIFLSQLVLYLL